MCTKMTVHDRSMSGTPDDGIKLSDAINQSIVAFGDVPTRDRENESHRWTSRGRMSMSSGLMSTPTPARVVGSRNSRRTEGGRGGARKGWRPIEASARDADGRRRRGRGRRGGIQTMAVTTSTSASTTDEDAKSEGAIARDGDEAGGNASDASERVPIPSVVDYVVKRGDTLYEIAATHGTTTQAIAEASDIGIRRTIEVGETLRVPLNAQRASFAIRSRYGLVPKHSTVGTTPASKRLRFLKQPISALEPKKRTTEVASWSTPVSLAHVTRAHTFGSGTILAFGLLAVFSQARSNRVRTRVASALSTKAAPTDGSLAESPLTGERATSSMDALRADIREVTEPAESERRPVVVNPSQEIESTTSTSILRDVAAESTQIASETEKPLERPKEETGSAKEDASSATKDKETKTKREGREAFVEMNAISGVKTTAIVVDVDEMESKVEEVVSTGREKEAPKRRVSKLSPKRKRSAIQSRRRLNTPNVKVDEVEDLGYLPAALIGKGVYVAQVAFDFTRALMDKAFKKLSS